MRVSIYSPLFNVITKSFDYQGALDNWAVYADEISLAVNTSTDGTFETVRDYAVSKGYPVSIVQTTFDYEQDPFCYGKIENAALQNCTGDLLIQQNLDERLLVDPKRLEELHKLLESRYDISAFFVPTIDLYGSHHNYLAPIKQKWYIHRQGLFRGASRVGLKPDGRPDYNKTSTDELLDMMGNLVPTVPLVPDLSLSTVVRYVADGWPITFHLGYVDFKERLDRSLWWKSYWEKATGGDPNQHPTTIEEMAARETQAHGLPLWPTKS